MTTKRHRRLAKSEAPFPTEAVVQVGDGGRGFIVDVAEQRYVVTAAHCIPLERYPTPHLANSTSELTVPACIGPLTKKARPTVWGEFCVLSLADDVAVFREPDCQYLYEQHSAYGKFTGGVALKIGVPPLPVPSYEWNDVPGAQAWVLSIDRIWTPCTVHSNGRFLTIAGAKIESGMSGSPILNAGGAAIGLVSTGKDGFGENYHPSLADCLPRWLVCSELKAIEQSTPGEKS